MKWWIVPLLVAAFAVVLVTLRQPADKETKAATMARLDPGLSTPSDESLTPALDAESFSEQESEPLPAQAVDPSVEVILAEEKQKRIWDSEHATFELETYFGKSFRKAIRDRNPAAIEQFFTDGAVVELISDSDGHQDRAATVSEIRDDSSTNRSADVTGLANQLIDSLASMEEIQQSKLRVLQLQTEDGIHWTSRILLKFVGLTSNGQPCVVESEHALGLTFSSDDEIKTGRIVSAWSDQSRSTRQSERQLMKEVTESTGLADLPLPDNWLMTADQRSQYWFQIAVEDFNKDGYPDIAAATITGDPLLLRSDGGKQFVDITKELRLKSWNEQSQSMQSLAAWIDFNNDSWPDLLLGNRLYRNLKGKAFLDVTRKSQLRFGHFPMGAAVADYDCDGLADLYVMYQHHAETSTSGPMPWVGDNKNGAVNQLWRNEGGGRFRDVTEESNAGGGTRHSFAAVWHFLDDDRYPDLYVANDFGQNVHLRNRGDGTFEDVSLEANTADFATSMGVTSGDLDNDGHPELYVANMYSKMGRRIIGGVCAEDYPTGIYEQIRGSCAGNRLYMRQRGAQTYSEVSELAGVNEVGWAYAPLMADFDADGLLDIYATTGFMSAYRDKPDG